MEEEKRAEPQKRVLQSFQLCDDVRDSTKVNGLGPGLGYCTQLRS